LALTHRGLCSHHSQGHQAAFAKFCHDTSRNIIKAMNDYRQTYPRHLLYNLTTGHHTAELCVARSLSQDILEFHSSMANIRETLETGTLNLSYAVFSDEVVQCEGMSLSNVFTCVACRLSAVLTDFNSIQTMVHLTDAMQYKHLLTITQALFKQITCIDGKYTLAVARKYETPFIDLEKTYLGSIKNKTGVATP
jgi:hypothetical protein